MEDRPSDVGYGEAGCVDVPLEVLEVFGERIERLPVKLSCAWIGSVGDLEVPISQRGRSGASLGFYLA